MKKSMVLILVSLGNVFGWAQDDAAKKALEYSVAELRASMGLWQVETEFLNAEGKAVRTVSGTYEFSWVIPDRLAMGKNQIPELEMASAILFYIREATGEIEMTSVGKDGKLWVMTGPLGADWRMTQPFDTQNGGKQQLRFTRYNAEATRFESKMEYTLDGGKTWTTGNHQTFIRKKV